MVITTKPPQVSEARVTPLTRSELGSYEERRVTHLMRSLMRLEKVVLLLYDVHIKIPH